MSVRVCPCLGKALAGLVGFAALMGVSAGADLVPARRPIREGPQSTPLPATPRDHVRLVLEPPPREITLGEPLTLRLRLVNHTDFTINVMTNFALNGDLAVRVRPYGERERSTTGPYPAGRPGLQDYILYPLEEYPVDVVLWGDRETPNGLMFPRPGRYYVRLELQVAVAMTRLQAAVPLVDPQLQPIEQIEVNVLPPRSEHAALIERLVAERAFVELTLRQVPPGLQAELGALADAFADSPLAPFMNYALATQRWRELEEDPEDEATGEEAARRFERAAAPPSAVQVEALVDMARFYDARRMIAEAQRTCRRLIEVVPAALRPRYGSLPVVEKYLPGSREIDPALYWDLLE